MVGTWLSIVPPLIALAMVLLTKRVLLSLGSGIITASIIVASFAPVDSMKYIIDAFWSTAWEEGALNDSSLSIITFLFLLGILTAFVTLSGGSKAFAAWAIKRVKTQRSAKMMTVFLGILIFVDDYFNALAVGQIARPVTDAHKISRAKLAYLIDSTSAPICVISPISSWGAFLIGQIGIILSSAAVSYSALSAFIMMAPMNFYVIATLALVFFLAWMDIDLFSMKKHEERARETGELYDPDKPIPGQLKNEFPLHSAGRVRDLVAPILALVFVALIMMIITGYAEAGVMDIFAIFENTNVPISLVIGGLVANILALILYRSQKEHNETYDPKLLIEVVKSGVKVMLPAVLILIFAWALSYLIDHLETGAYLAEVVEKSNIAPAYLPVIIFLLAGVMAFSTGTSWGTFGILLPIAGSIMIHADPELLLPSLAAVLAGSVLGDHCSPISDTTILSSTGAGSNLMDHVITQLPYALISAAIATIGYLVLGITGSVWIGLVAVLIALVITFIILTIKFKNKAVSTAS